jgi:aspartate aminotransferase
MPGLSKKGKAMPESPIRKLVPYAEEAERQGKKVFYLNIGQPDIKTPEVALEAIRNYDEEVVAYSHSAGNESYRRKLAGYYQNLGLDVSLEDLLITTGGSEALLFAFMSCFDEGEELIVPEPYYANYNGFSTAAAVTVKPIVSDIRSGFALPQVEAFEEAINEKTKGILVCNPGNPTGYLYSREEIEQLGDLARKYDLYLFADEVYREFCYDGKEHFSVLNLKGLEKNIVMVDSVSKRYSMCGARIGALVSRNQELMATALKFAQARLSPPSFGQVAGEAALDTPDSYFEEVIGEYLDRRNRLVEGLNSIEGVYCPKPSGAFYCIAELPVDDADDFCQWMLEHFSYENQTVMMAPASGFYSNPETGKNQVRVAYVLEEASLEKAVECLRMGLKAYVEKYDHAL